MEIIVTVIIIVTIYTITIIENNLLFMFIPIISAEEADYISPETSTM